jgi:hypothetical protein
VQLSSSLPADPNDFGEAVMDLIRRYRANEPSNNSRDRLGQGDG